MPDFQKWLDRLDSLGYVNRWTLINAKDHGVPQNRLRVFCLSMREDVAFDYQFPEAIPLTKSLEDVLETEVEDRYFLSDESAGKFLKANDKNDAVFVQFDVPPTHEAAMLLKTWLSLAMKAYKAWEMSPSDIENKIAELKPKFAEVYDAWLTDGMFPSDEFERLYYENLERI